MSVKLLNEHHLEFLSLKGGCTGTSEFTLVKTPLLFAFWESIMLDFSVRLSEQFDSSLTWSKTPKLEPRRQISRQGPVNQNQDDLFIFGAHVRIQRGEGTGGQDPPEKAQKCRVSSQYWSGSPASSARQQIREMAFRWRADDGPFILVTKLSRFIALTKLSRSAHGACFLIILNQRTCRATECVECEITHMSKKRTQS